MPSPTWDEYLADASAHLAALRRAAERGVEPPGPLDHPVGPIPVERQAEAQRLAVGYDQLAVEVVSLMSMIEQRRFPSTRRNPHQEQGPARYIDTPV
jgi:hypothetical protein